MPFKPVPILLTASKITLRPLQHQDAHALFVAGNHLSFWQWVQPNYCASLLDTQAWVASSLAAQDRGEHLPFVIIDNQTQALLGTTRFCAIRVEDRSIDIGFTFICPQFQRTYANTQAKYVLLEHAFESLGAVRVEFKTHENNQQSRRAISNLGASFEGILRHQRILADGTLRNTALFSIIHTQWPEVKARLLHYVSSFE